MSGLYLKPTCGNYNRVLPNGLIQRRNLFKEWKKLDWAAVDRSIDCTNK
jgi:hypothetical protein